MSALDVNLASLSSMTLEQLVVTRYKMAESINRQIRRLRKAGYDKSGALSKIAEPYLRNRRGFSERKTPLPVKTDGKTAKRIEYEQKRKEIAEIRAMQRFYKAQTYRIKGIKEQREKAKESFKKQLGVEITDEEIKDMYEMEAFEWLKTTLGSDFVNAIARAINAGAATVDEVRTKINRMRYQYNEEDLMEMPIDDIFDLLGINFKPEYLNPLRREEE